MPRNLRTIGGLAAALAFAGLAGPASAQRLPQPRPECMQQVRDYCAANWRTDPQMHFATQQACVDAYTEQCYYDWSYFV
jgi:hypothetical protein